MNKRDKDYRSHRISSNRRRTPGGKGDLDISDPARYREGYDRAFGEKPDKWESRDMSWLEDERKKND